MPAIKGNLFTKRRKDALIEANRRATPMNAQASIAGISRACLYNWIDQGRRELEDFENGRVHRLSPHAKWFREYEKAKGETSSQVAANVTEQAKNDADKGMVWLERVHPEEFGKRVAVTTRQEIPVKLIIIEKDGDAWKQHRSGSIETSFEPDDAIDTTSHPALPAPVDHALHEDSSL